MKFVLTNFLENLPENWNIIIMHGNKNINYVKEIIDNSLKQYKHRITLDNLNVDNLTIDEYNKLLYSLEFYNKIPTETFLIFQTDSIICSKNKHKLKDFIDYDYVGAPWLDRGGVGNGGLSLRKKSKMIEKIKKCKNTYINEDIFFSDNNCVKIHKPSVEKATHFSVETIPNSETFGVHKPWLYLSALDYKNLENSCTELTVLKELNMK
jgi:hypothetical protein